MLVWRLSHRAHSAFDGEGGLLRSGRWHRAGVRIIYTSEHLSLAALEFFVNVGPDEQPVQTVARSAEIPDDMPGERLLPADLPRDWRRLGANALRERGMRWHSEQRTALLVVPSALIPQENNCILNPAHPDFARIRVNKIEPFIFDPRMWK
jgi:RES domain-containing protein